MSELHLLQGLSPLSCDPIDESKFWEANLVEDCARVLVLWEPTTCNEEVDVLWTMNFSSYAAI